MKKIFIASILITALGLSSNAQINKVNIIATGLTCSMCSNAIYKKLQTLNGIDSITIDLNKNLFAVNLKPNHALSPSDFKNAIENAGFFIGSMILNVKLPIETIAIDNTKTQYTYVNADKQNLSGEKQLKVLNKGFVTEKEFKKYVKTYTNYPDYKNNTNNILHVKVL